MSEQNNKPNDIDAREAAERIAHLYRNGSLTVMANIFVPAILVLMLWFGGKHDFLQFWLLANLALSLIRFALLRVFSRSAGAKMSATGWGRCYTVGAFISGMLWGLLPIFVMDATAGNNVLVIMLVMYGMIAGSISSNSSFYPAYVAYAVPSGGMLSLRLMMEGGDFLYLAGLLLIFLLVNLGFAWNHRKIVVESIRQRLINQQLLDDVEQKRQLAERANNDKSRFLAAVSHDLRQPLHALDLFHGSLASRLNDDGQRELLDLARNASHSLGEMLGELMDIARFDAGKVEVSRKIAPLAPMVRECVEELRPLAGEKGLDLRLRLPERGCVDTDPVLFKRILRNLLTNAIRHTETGGILVGTRRRGEMLRIEVHDTGPGIPEDSLPHIFDEFYQVNNPERDREKGLGLGLSIVRRVAGMLGHGIDVRSRPGRGSCFAVSLPLCSVAGQCDGEEIQSDVGGDDLTGLFVVFVDDDKTILRGMRGLLRDWGCEVLLAESGEALLEELRAHAYPRPDVLICDYRLRDAHTGLEAVAAVRAHFSDDSLPAVIISGDVHPDVLQAVKNSGCLWLEKPVREDVLKRTIAESAA